ncbi:MAG: DoxX family protein [Candidatus Sumerlaeaceae bacterium]|jgi:putative oxidoreductase
MAILRTHRNSAAWFCRIALASVFLPHGLDKLVRLEPLGWAGPEVWASQFLSLFAIPWIPETWKLTLAQAIAWTEVVAAVSCILGLLVRVAMVPLILDLAWTIIFVSGKNGFWIDHTIDGVPAPGFEYHLVLILIALGLFFSGAGSFSLDKLIAGEDYEEFYYEEEDDYEEQSPGR